MNAWNRLVVSGFTGLRGAGGRGIGFLPLAWPANGKTLRRYSDGQVEKTVLSPAIL